ncbi:726_t:CDS:2 [Entrophospora sp. SA101]|nr:726_t:CDS:2 [Entrophospora sp. SA101]
MKLIPKCLNALRYPGRLLEERRKTYTQEVFRFPAREGLFRHKNELKIIGEYYDETSEIGAKSFKGKILREHLKNQEKQLFTSFKTVELWKEYFEKSKERYESEIKIRDEEIKRSHQEIDGLKKTINKLEAENNSLKGHNTTGIYN